MPKGWEIPMHLPEFVLLVLATIAAIAAGLAVLASKYSIARVLFWIAGVSFWSLGVLWSVSSEGYSLQTQLLVSGVVGAIAAVGLSWTLWEIREKEKAEQPKLESVSHHPTAEQKEEQQGQGGGGGGGEIFGNNGTIIGGRGGNVGSGGIGRGGDGGGGVIHGDGGKIIGGEGGSVDGTNIWFPPAQSGFIQYLESQGQTPDFNVQYPGAGGASGGWLERQQVIVKIREEFFRKAGHEAKIKSSKIEDVPLNYINKKLEEAGYPWRARIEKKYWYLYYVP
jgi:hypothetical protein